MSQAAEAATPSPLYSGHNRISTQALTSLARAAAGQSLGVPAHDVRAWKSLPAFRPKRP